MKKNKQLNYKRKWLVYIVFPIFLSVIFYYLFCPDVLFVKAIDKLTGGFHLSADYSSKFFVLMRFYLFDFCWAFSLMSAVLYVFYDFIGCGKLFGLIVLFEVVLEMIHILPIMFSTFDLFDIVVEVLANAVSILVYRRGMGA